MHLSGVRPSVRLSGPGPEQQTRCCRFAAVDPADRSLHGTKQRGVRRANAGSATLSAYVGG